MFSFSWGPALIILCAVVSAFIVFRSFSLSLAGKEAKSFPSQVSAKEDVKEEMVTIPRRNINRAIFVVAGICFVVGVTSGYVLLSVVGVCL